MLKRKAFHYLNRFLQEICSSKKPFGGKCVILGGDWRQLAPCEQGSREDKIHASIKLDPLFQENFKTLKYSIDMINK